MIQFATNRTTCADGEKYGNDFEVFEQGPIEQSAKRIYVTLNGRGNFYLNRRAIEALGEPDAVTLMYDRRRSIIGVTRAPVERQNAFRLKRKERGQGSRMVYAANFCRHYSINPDETLRFTAAEVNKDGVLVLDLNEVRVVKK